MAKSKTAQKVYEQGVNAKLSGVPLSCCRPPRTYESDFKRGYNDTTVSVPEASNDLDAVFGVAELVSRAKSVLVIANHNPVLIQRSNRHCITNEYVIMTRERFEQLIKNEGE